MFGYARRASVQGFVPPSEAFAQLNSQMRYAECCAPFSHGSSSIESYSGGSNFIPMEHQKYSLIRSQRREYLPAQPQVFPVNPGRKNSYLAKQKQEIIYLSDSGGGQALQGLERDEELGSLHSLWPLIDRLFRAETGAKKETYDEMKYGDMKYVGMNNELPAYSQNALHKPEMEPDALLEMIRKEKESLKDKIIRARTIR